MNRFDIALKKKPPPGSEKSDSGQIDFSPIKPGTLLVALSDGTLAPSKDFPNRPVAGRVMGVNNNGVVIVQLNNGLIANMARAKSGLSRDNVEFVPTPLPSPSLYGITLTRHIRYG